MEAVPTDRAGGAFDELSGTLACHPGLPPCNFFSAQAHRLFDFFDSAGQRLQTPFFLEYKTWKLAMKQGIVDVCRELPGSDPEKVTCGRAANHTNFPTQTSRRSIEKRST